MQPHSAETMPEDRALGSEKKILRACIVQGGKVIDEQRFRKRDSLTIGHGPKNTFVLSDASLPKSHALFVVRHGKYELVLTESMRGKVSIVGTEQPVDIANLKAQGLLRRRGEYYCLPLTDGHRGKVMIGDITIIFQFVIPPPTPPKPQLPAAARGSVWARWDTTYVACYLICALSEMAFIGYLHTVPRPAQITLENMDERLVKMIMPDKKPEVKKPEKKLAENDKDKSKKKDDSKKTKAAEPKEERAEREKEPPSKAQQERRAGIRKNIASRGILAVLGTAGAGSAAGAVADVLGEGKIAGDLDSAFEGISGVGMATPGGQRSTRGGGSGKEANIGGLATSGGGKVGTGGKAEAKVGSVQTGEAEVDGSLDSGQVAKVVQSRMRMVQDCYERELKRDPNLQGKIEIEFTIGEDGRVETARVSSNKMGSDTVGACIVGRIRTWRFPKPSGGSVTVNFPFIFAPSS